MYSGLKIKFTRMKIGLTQKQLREKSNTSLNTIVALEKGKIDGVRVGTLKKIANALNTTVQELFFSE
ncbi:XRE family transcriptional regulator [Clostridium botulinum]|nr:XRE family transcriptional regulator [Clostridium botulinum]